MSSNAKKVLRLPFAKQTDEIKAAVRQATESGSIEDYLEIRRIFDQQMARASNQQKANAATMVAELLETELNARAPGLSKLDSKIEKLEAEIARLKSGRTTRKNR